MVVPLNFMIILRVSEVFHLFLSLDEGGLLNVSCMLQIPENEGSVMLFISFVMICIAMA